MKVTITTSSKYRKMVEEILHNMDLLGPGDEAEEVDFMDIVLHFPDDTYYRPIAAWCANAIACGLVFGVQVER